MALLCARQALPAHQQQYNEGAYGPGSALSTSRGSGTPARAVGWPQTCRSHHTTLPRAHEQARVAGQPG
jgi:hypothetical protein